MNFALNFDIFFAIGCVGMLFSAIFKKSGKITKNFILFLISTLTIGILVYFKIDVKLFPQISGPLAPLFSKLPASIMKPEFLGLWYFILLLILDGVLFLILKLLTSFRTERGKFKKDLTYTPKHHGLVSFLVTIFKFAISLIMVLIVFDFANTHMNFDVSNSYVIKYFNEWFKPVLELLGSRGKEFFGLFGF